MLTTRLNTLNAISQTTEFLSGSTRSVVPRMILIVDNDIEVLNSPRTSAVKDGELCAAVLPKHCIGLKTELPQLQCTHTHSCFPEPGMDLKTMSYMHNRWSEHSRMQVECSTLPVIVTEIQVTSICLHLASGCFRMQLQNRDRMAYNA